MIAQPEPATTKLEEPQSEIGSVFVSNYPPYSFWSKQNVPKAIDALHSPPLPASTIGLYLHIPFCRKRCKFCYFRVYTDKNSEEIRVYLEALAREVSLYGKLPSVRGRRLKFVYFGGGTPSFINARQLRSLVHHLKQSIPWKGAEEITFECEPGTLTEAKLEAILEIGVTRLSLGIENFDDRILEENGRAHHSQEIFRVIPWIRRLNFDQLNIDLIAGMVGETWETWRETVRKTIEIDADSITIYQMELPYNTIYTGDLLKGSLGTTLADWDTKRYWHAYAFEKLSGAGYEISSAYTMVKKNKKCDFVYRNAVWRGSDMIGTGVASFSHMSGVHFQNNAFWEPYIRSVQKDQLPLDRAFVTTERERLTREMILQLKLGTISTDYFRRKFSADLLEEFGEVYRKLQKLGFLEYSADQIQLTTKGLLQVDHLLPEFYDPRYRNARYT